MPSSATSSSSTASRDSCGSEESSGRQKTNISTLSNWCTRNIPRVSLPAAPDSRRERVRLELLAYVHGRQGHLRGPGQVEVVALDTVDVGLVRGEEPRPVHGRLAHEDGREHRREPLLHQPLQREAVEGELHERGVADPVGEARARDPGAPLHVDPAEREMVERLEGELAPLAAAADLDGIVVGEAVRRARVRWIGHPREELVEAGLRLGELALQALELRLHALQLLELLGRRLALQLLARAKLLDPRQQRPPLLVRLQQRVEVLRRPLAVERSAPRLRIVPRGLDVDHRPESRKASITWATPSSAAGGQTQSATASTRSWAFATATP